MDIFDIKIRLKELQDIKYRDFNLKLIPGIKGMKMIGVRTPELRKLSVKIMKSACCRDFLNVLPHEYFEENSLHAIIISASADFDECINELYKFLPYVDNWAVCDIISPKILSKDKKELMKHISVWLASKHTYTVRFAIGMLMSFFLDTDFKKEQLVTVADIKSDEYYIKMMQAWYFATALYKQYDETVKLIEQDMIDEDVKKKTIQKAVESYRISSEHKEYLKGFRKK
ncbi:DNA alkylation repair protein [Johnsonella ignava]|jgi:hypothetical protein|uniref:DNA alkylation repair protein n=1 Tax=Johnsonella ignava TaxID=43995 RepID=UPI0023F3809F|nr:DNA alkylation repair protein [Johnsonella ignava]